jgi:hypothetical protein
VPLDHNGKHTKKEDETMMTTRDYFYALNDEQQQAIADKLGITWDYLRKLMTRHRKPSPALARQLEEVTPYTAADWRPDIFGPRHAA